MSQNTVVDVASDGKSMSIGMILLIFYWQKSDGKGLRACCRMACSALSDGLAAGWH